MLVLPGQMEMSSAWEEYNHRASQLDARRQGLETGNEVFYRLHRLRHLFGGLVGEFENELLCGACSSALAPIDWLLTNSVIRAGMDWIAKEVCIE